MRKIALSLMVAAALFGRSTGTPDIPDEPVVIEVSGTINNSTTSFKIDDEWQLIGVPVTVNMMQLFEDAGVDKEVLFWKYEDGEWIFNQGTLGANQGAWVKSKGNTVYVDISTSTKSSIIFDTMQDDCLLSKNNIIYCGVDLENMTNCTYTPFTVKCYPAK